jgi:hypothetical protein
VSFLSVEKKRDFIASDKIIPYRWFFYELFNSGGKENEAV